MRMRIVFDSDSHHSIVSLLERHMLSPRRKFLDTCKELINTATTDSSFCSGSKNDNEHVGQRAPFSLRRWQRSFVEYIRRT